MIADSWFGSVACALELFRRNLFAIMNVKTGHRGFPKNSLLQVVGEVKGSSAAAKKKRAERRGKQIAFTKDFKVGPRTVTVSACGHNKKVPLLLVYTASSMLSGNEHVKQWTTMNAEGEAEVHTIRTPQPQVTELYRKYMNLVDLHNKLRQGERSMADTWKTHSWVNRHFAELLGFVEVNIFKCLSFFCKGKWSEMSHNEFRRRLAWSLLTLGNEVYPADLYASESSTATNNTSPYTSAGVNSASKLYSGPMEHRYVSFDPKRNERHTCGYCGKVTRKYCLTCNTNGHGIIAICGRRSKRDCIDRHQRGDSITHGSWKKQAI